MTVENISWSISTKECCRPRRGLNPRPPGLQSDGASNWATEAGNQSLCCLLIESLGYCRIYWHREALVINSFSPEDQNRYHCQLCSHLVWIYSVCHFVLLFFTSTLFAIMDRLKFKVERNSEVKELILSMFQRHLIQWSGSYTVDSLDLTGKHRDSGWPNYVIAPDKRHNYRDYYFSDFSMKTYDEGSH